MRPLFMHKTFNKIHELLQDAWLFRGKVASRQAKINVSNNQELVQQQTNFHPRNPGGENMTIRF